AHGAHPAPLFHPPPVPGAKCTAGPAGSAKPAAAHQGRNSRGPRPLVYTSFTRLVTATAAVPHGRHPADRWANRAPRRDVRDRRVRGLLGHRAQPRSGGNATMLRTLKCPVIALEEHYWDKELAALFVGAEGVRDPEMLRR